MKPMRISAGRYCFSLLFLGGALALAQAPAISPGGTLNGASFQKGTPIALGSLVSIFGTNLASGTAQADSIPLSTSLGGVSVAFVTDSKTEPAPMLFANGSQINAQVPWDLVPANTNATVNVVVTTNGVASAPQPVTVGPFSPGVFASGGRAIAVNQDGTLAWPANAVSGVTTHPAKPGDVIILYATGLGMVDSPPASGAASLDKLRNTLVPPSVLIGGLSAKVLFSGLSPQFVGVNQLNVEIPNVAPGDAVTVQLQQGGITSPDGITLAVTQ